MSDLLELRKRLDQLNDEILGLVLKRFETVESVARWKHENGVAIADLSREREVAMFTEQRALELGMPPGFGTAFAEMLIHWAKVREAAILEAAEA